MQIFTNTVMIQGHHAVGVLQIGSIVFVFGDNGEKENTGPNWELLIFRPHSSRWLHFKSRRGFTRRVMDWFTQKENPNERIT